MLRPAAVLALMLCAAPALAEYVDDPSFQLCANATGYYDVAATNDWLARLRSSDGSAMREVAGTWYAEFQANVGGVDYAYSNTIRWTPQGVMDFQTRTCSAPYGVTGCSDDYGHGLYTAHREAGGGIFVTRNITSLTRVNQCGGASYRMENGVLVDQNGKAWALLRQ